MNDERTDTHPTHPDEHYCEHPGCNAWGGQGFSSGSSAKVQWWCDRHYPYWPDEIKAKYAALPA